MSAAAAFVGDALGLKPIMTFENGDSKILAKVRGEKNLIPTIMDRCRKTRQAESPYMVIKADNAPMADALIQACQEEFGAEPDMVFPIGGIAINAGPNLIGVIYREQ